MQSPIAKECKKYFCNKCQNHHQEILDDHKIINLNNLDEVFIDKCKEDNHNYKLEFFCKEHNILCCVACTSKIKNVHQVNMQILMLSHFVQIAKNIFAINA